MKALIWVNTLMALLNFYYWFTAHTWYNGVVGVVTLLASGALWQAHERIEQVRAELRRRRRV